MKIRKFLALILVLTMALSLVACGGAEKPAEAAPAASAAPAATEAAAEAAPAKLLDKPLEFKVSYIENPDTAFGTVMPKAFEKITELTNGELKFEIFPSALLGSEADVAEQIANGAPMICTVGMASLVDSLAPLATPYVLESIEEVLNFSKTEYYQKGVADMAALGYVPLCMGSLGIRHIISSKEVKNAADFNGLIIRMAATQPSQGFATVLGGTPATAAWADNYSLIETGAIHACEAPTDLLYSSALYEVCDYLCMSAHLYTPFQFVIADDFWAQIPAEYQAVIQEVLADACAEVAELYANADAEFVAKFKEKGTTVCEDPDIASFAACLPELFEYLGLEASVYESIRASVEAVK